MIKPVEEPPERCPFCGAAIKRLHLVGRAEVRVRCDACGCEGPVVSGFALFADAWGVPPENRDDRREAYRLAGVEAVRAWNRAPRPEVSR